MTTPRDHTVRLPHALDQFLAGSVSSGRYGSAEEVICAALRLLEEREQLAAELRRQIAVGVEQADRGELIDGQSVFDEIASLSRDRKGHAA